MHGPILLTLSLLILLFGLASRRSQGSMITPPMVFVAFGFMAGAPNPRGQKTDPLIARDRTGNTGGGPPRLDDWTWTQSSYCLNRVR